jgi:hypothetical protein
MGRKSIGVFDEGIPEILLKSAVRLTNFQQTVKRKKHYSFRKRKKRSITLL